MNRSTDRFLTTHTGSLPRPDDLIRAMFAKEEGVPVDPAALAEQIARAVDGVVQKQAEAGVDIVDDGEMSKPSFVTYVQARLAGFAPSHAPAGLPWAGSREVLAFPAFYASASNTARIVSPLACTGPVRYVGHDAVRTDIANLQTALSGVGGKEAFLPAVSPSNIEGRYTNKYYATEEEYLFAIADAMHEEYKAIVGAGLLVQIDDPRLVTYYIMQPQASIADCRRWAEVRVAALNHALRDIPRDRVRFHTCYSINMGPRVHDMQLKDIVDVILKVRAGAYSFEAANPRHEHEWRVWEDVTLPDDALIIPGVITQSTVLVEHPELVAERIMKFASVVGRERIIAGADCGFATFAGSTEIHPSIAWAKLSALVDGARLASTRLWGRT